MNIGEKIELVTRFTEEVIGKDELDVLFSKKEQLKHYIGFEISGKIHLGTGLVCMQKLKDIADAGVKTHILLADYHTWINDKLGGDLETIRRVAVGYFKEGLSVAYKCLGGKQNDLNFILASDFYHNNDKYWETVIEVSKNTSLSRIKRSISILGRKEGEDVDFAKLIYPAMQVADIFVGGYHFSQTGLDQRKANVIARDVANHLRIFPLKAGGEVVKPIAVHHHLLLGLEKSKEETSGDKKEALVSMKMSKSKPDSAIFIHDNENEIRRKIKKAYCPEREIEFNPIIDWMEHLVFVRENNIVIERENEHGGNLNISSVNELKKIYQSGELHPVDLKNFISNYLIDLLRPVREYFSEGEPKKMLEELEGLIKKS